MIKDSVNTELETNQILQRLKTARSLSMLIHNISRVLVILAGKRTTLAEKAIQEELAACAETTSVLLYAINRSYKDQKYCCAESDCLQLRQISIELNKRLLNFIKAANYNFNYLEQYFEHDFWIALSQRMFAAQLIEIIDRLGIVISTKFS